MIKNMYSKNFLILLLPIGLIWLKSSINKITEGKFVPSFAQTMSKLSSGNPNAWFKSLITSTAIPNAKLFAPAIMWGEFFTAICIVGGITALLFSYQQKLALWVLLFGLLGGIILNSLFYLGSAWTGVSTESLNLLMLTIEAIAAFFILKTILP